MKKTAAIITMHCPLNYGAVLQTYALQRTLEDMKLSVSVIDYNPYYIVYDQSLMFTGDGSFSHNIFTRWAYRIIKGPVKFRRKRLFDNFRRKELHLTARYENYQQIVDAKIKADFFFCGSDQIWNSINESCKDPAYFLSFVADKSKRNSYAASGNLNPPYTVDVKKHTIPMINELSRVSMREDVTIANIQPYINKKIEHVCDPVFLLKADEWLKLANKATSFEKNCPFVLIYPMGGGVENVIQKGFELAKKVNLPLYCITASQRRDKRINKFFNVSPYTFIKLVNQCDYLVTNSFHGTAFGIIFEKRFWSCVAEGANQRLSSLLDLCGLSSRMISSDFVFHDCESCIDYTKSRNKLNDFILKSKNYLLSIVDQGHAEI